MEIKMNLRPKILLPIVYCLIVCGCGVAQMPKTETVTSPSPEIRAIKAVDIVERADQMCKKENDCRMALLLYDQAIKERGESTDLFKKRGMAHYALKEIDLAISDFSKAIELQNKLKKQDSSLYFIRGLSKSLLDNEDRQSTCTDLRKAEELGYDLRSEANFEEWYTEHCKKVH